MDPLSLEKCFFWFTFASSLNFREQRNKNRANANKGTKEQTGISIKQMGSAISWWISELLGRAGFEPA
jgi:hypothetical protein